MISFVKGSMWILKSRAVSVMIVSGNRSNERNKCVSYIKLTKMNKKNTNNILIELDDGSKIYAQCGQIFTCFKDELGEYMGNVGKCNIIKVNEGLMNYLDIDYNEIYEKSINECEDIINRINAGKKYISEPPERKRLQLSKEAKMDIMKNYTRENRDRLAEKYGITPRKKVSQIAYALRSKYKKKGRI